MNNIADQHPDLVKTLYARLQAWQKEVEALIPEQNPTWPSITKRPLVPNNAHV